MQNTKTSKKMLNLYILQILQKYSDENHKLRQKDIIDLLKHDYCLSCERKAVSRNISFLMEAGFDICSDNGYYLAEREFDDCELRLLIDSLLFARQIPHSQRKMLIKKLSGLSNQYFQSRVDHIFSVCSSGPENRQLFYTIEVLDTAISKRRQVRFVYNSYDVDKKLHPRREEPFLVNPYQMAAANGRLYLICNYDKYDTISNYRLDRITDIELTDFPSKPIRTFQKSFSLPQHMAEHIYMFSGESTHVKFRANRERIGDILDWFANCDFSDIDRTHCTVSVYVNQTAMLYWALQYGQYIEILSPQSLRDQVADAAYAIFEKYQPSEEKA